MKTLAAVIGLAPPRPCHARHRAAVAVRGADFDRAVVVGGDVRARRVSNDGMVRTVMAIDASESFAHGSYADTDGVTFHGPPVHGFWEDRLAVSDRFIRPLFNAVLACAWRGDDASVPRVVSEWNEITGWADASGIQQLTPSDATALVEALQRVSEADLVPHLPASEAPAEYLRCAAVIAEFIHSRVDRGIPVYIEDD